MIISSHNILVLVFCCLPIGIVGLIKSTECKNAIAVGDAARAEATVIGGKEHWLLPVCVCGFRANWSNYNLLHCYSIAAVI